MTTVALLGAHGQIARGLIGHLPADWDLRLFSRDPAFPNPEALSRGVTLARYEEFSGGEYDLIINAAGPGDPAVHRAIGADIFRITERFDNMVLDYLGRNPVAGYVNLSTGAIYGLNFEARHADDPVYSLHVNALNRGSAYVLAKLCAEAKHRNSQYLRIADLRIFGYFSRLVDLKSQFFLAQAVSHLRAGNTFHTHPADFVRDYISQEDLAAQIAALYECGLPNGAFDAVSAEPITKFGILNALRDRFGLRFVVEGEISDSARFSSQKHVTLGGARGKNIYCAKMTSLQLISREVEELIRSSRGGRG
jgi:NAD dependent epimerase/dehydratase family